MNFLISFCGLVQVSSNLLDFLSGAGVWHLRKKELVGILLSFAWALGCQTIFAAESPAQSEPNITRLEFKFFQHDYPKDSVETRLERLEKMVFGEVRAGSNYERLSILLSSVPSLSAQGSDGEGTKGDKGTVDSASSDVKEKTTSGVQAKAPRSDYVPPEGSKYPAVTAIETRLLGKDFAHEPINKRLDRLEVKVFGKPSGLDDLSERVDSIKRRTGVDIARQAPAGSDWADEYDDNLDYDTAPPVASSDEDTKSFSGRDLKKDMQRAFGMPSGGSGYTSDRFAGTGTYGMQPSPLPNSTSGLSKGSNVPRYDEMPSPAPPRPAPNVTARNKPYPAMGLNEQVGALEQEVFGRTYVKDPLPARLNRLESTVFPQEKTWVERSLPERVNHLTSVIPLSQPGRRIAQGSRSGTNDPGYEDYGDLDPGQSQLTQPRATSGLSKIINSISSFLGGGYSGGYPGASGNLITDPQTGLLYDSMTGSLIDPVTGVVVGQRLSPGAGAGMGGFGSFSNGFSPFGSVPYGMGSGSGMRFGFGGIGRYGYSMWP